MRNNRPGAEQTSRAKLRGAYIRKVGLARHKIAGSEKLRIESNPVRRVSRLSKRIAKLIIGMQEGDAPEDISLRISRNGSMLDWTVTQAAPGDAPISRPAQDLDRAFAEAGARGAARIAAIMDGPGMLTADSFAEALGTTRATVHQWRKRNRVLALDGATRGYRFPEWQIDRTGKPPFETIEALFAKLGSPWAVYRFLAQHHPALGGATGRDALFAGRKADILGAADAVVEGFS